MNRPDFLAAYIEAALFADKPEDATPGAELHADSVARLEGIAGAFYDAHTSDIMAYSFETNANAGHDLWYTQNGHGCGYWEENTRPDGTPSPCASNLDEACKGMPTLYMFEGDDEDEDGNKFLHVEG